MWAQTINDAPPVSAVLNFNARSRAKPTQKRSEPRSRRQFRLRDLCGIDAAMGLREKTAPREGDNRSTMTGLAQRNRGADHCQSSAQNQDRRILGGVPRTRVLPWTHAWPIGPLGESVPAAPNRHIEDRGFGAGEAEGEGVVALAQTCDNLAKPAHAPWISVSQAIFNQPPREAPKHP